MEDVYHIHIQCLLQNLFASANSPFLTAAVLFISPDGLQDIIRKTMNAHRYPSHPCIGKRSREPFIKTVRVCLHRDCLRRAKTGY